MELTWRLLEISFHIINFSPKVNGRPSFKWLKSEKGNPQEIKTKQEFPNQI